MNNVSFRGADPWAGFTTLKQAAQTVQQNPQQATTPATTPEKKGHIARNVTITVGTALALGALAKWCPPVNKMISKLFQKGVADDVAKGAGQNAEKIAETGKQLSPKIQLGIMKANGNFHNLPNIGTILQETEKALKEVVDEAVPVVTEVVEQAAQKGAPVVAEVVEQAAPVVAETTEQVTQKLLPAATEAAPAAKQGLGEMLSGVLKKL